MKYWALVIDYNQKHTILLVLFVSVTTLFLSTNDAFADAPTANAGANQTAIEGAIVTLNGTTTHAGGATFQWSYNSTAPPDNPLTVNEAKKADASFTAGDVEEDTVLVFKLIVSHGPADSAPSFMNVTVTDVDPPVANAGPDQVVDEGDTVTLNGTGSTAGVTYQWTFSGYLNPRVNFWQSTKKAFSKYLSGSSTS